MSDIKIINAEVKDVNEKNGIFNVLLTFNNGRQAKLYCREEAGGVVKAYNLDVVGGKCPCCGKPACNSLYVKRDEFLLETQTLIKLPNGVETAGV